MPSPAFTAMQRQVLNPSGMSEAETGALVDLLISGELAAAEGADLLVAWTRRGETAVELAAVVWNLLARAQVPASPACMDLCGTGGSGLTRFNVSTTAAFVLAALGVPVAKHGNRGSARPNGGFDLLDALEVPYQLPPERLARLHAESGVCFLFARQVHPAVAAVAPARKLAAQHVRRTVFNLAGPLANPFRPRRQIVGVSDEQVARVVAEALVRLGSERAVVVLGHPGIDELSISGPSHLWEVHDGRVHHRIAEHFHQPGLTHDQLPGGDAPVNKHLFRRLLAGEERGPLLDLVCVNAGAALDCWHGRPILGDGQGVAAARAALTSGKVAAAFAKHHALARELAAAP